jgi:secreted trypsin-like serine protease
VNHRSKLLLLLALVVGLLAPAATASGQAAPEATRAPDSEIIGGGQASPGEYPFMVALLKRNVADRWQAQFCGGSLLAPRLVLTAAHCLTYPTRPAGSLDVLVGTNFLGGTAGQRIHASQIIVHPNYNPNTSSNDIALVRLASSAMESPIRIQPAGQPGLSAGGRTATVTGWGDRTQSDNTVFYPRQLFEVTVPIVNNQGCRAAYGSSYIAATMLCAGDRANGGRDSCQGDSGGPLFVRNGMQWAQVGVVSFGTGCGLRRYPGVYTRVSTYRNFINYYMPN